VLPDLSQLYSVDRTKRRLPNNPLRTVQLLVLHEPQSFVTTDAGSGATGASPATATTLITENKNVKNNFILSP